MTDHPRQDHGLSLLEVVLVLALVTALAGLAAPVTAHAIDAGRARHAAGFLASRFRLARHTAVMRATTTGLVFDRIGDRWTFRVCVDGNGNGLRRSEIATGDDECPEGPYDPEAMFPGMSVAVDPSVPDPGGGSGNADPVRFGRSELASFSPDGTATAGTLYLQSSRARQYAIRVGNVTGRTRILRFDPGTRRWVAGS